MMFRRCSVSAFALIALTSCGVIPTQYMPNGYRYNDDTPLSSPAPSRPWMDEADHPDLDHYADNTAAWQGAVYELITPLPGMLPPASTKLYLTTTPPATTADQAFDHYLRQALFSYGYRIEPLQSPGTTTLVYDAAPLTNAGTLKAAQAKYGKEFVKPDQVKGKYMLTLGVKSADGKKTLNTQSSVAILPYEKTEYARLPGLSYVPDQRPKASTRPIYERD